MAAGRWKRLRHRLELMGVRLMASMPRLLPYKLSIKAGGLLGRFAFDVVRVRRGVTLDNLDRAFGDTLSGKEKIRTGRRSYINFTKSMFELASLPRLGREKVRELIRYHDFHHVRNPVAEGRGVAVVTGHFGSWELLGASAAVQDLPVDFIVGEQTNSLVDEYVNGLRSSVGIGVIYKGIGVRAVFRSLREGRIVAILNDQDARRSGIFVDFFGIESSTYPGAGQFAFRTGCPVVSCHIVRRPDETHDAYFQPPLYADPEADPDAEARRITETVTKRLESAIRENPDHYFWAHKRWKTKPPG